MSGLIHIYCGDGKGKTTAAVGLAVRSVGAGRQVLFVQFFKSGNSSELMPLRKFDNIRIELCKTQYGFFKDMDELQKSKAKADYSEILEKAIEQSGSGIDLLILDEVISACNHGMVQEDRLADFLSSKPKELEVVLTGRNPSDRLLGLADYATEMKKIKHPFDLGIKARKGIEF